MTFAPASLSDLAIYWESQGGVSLGIVGNQRHCVGYHIGKDRIFGECACRPDGTCEPGLKGSDYSVQHPRDKAGLSNAASAIDLGKLDGSLAELRAFSRWLVAACMADPTAYRDIREVIYSPDGSKVQRYSGVDNEIHTGPGNGDNSHLTHTHISFFRDSEARSKVPMFVGYFAPDTSTGDDMTPLTITNQTTVDVDLTIGDPLYNPDGSPMTPSVAGVATTKRSPYGVTIGTTGYRVIPISPGSGKVVMALVPVSKVTIRPIPADASPYTQADIDAAITADRAKARVTWE